MFSLLFKATVVWLMIVVVAIANAAVREKLLTPVIGPEYALPVSGLLLSLLVLLVAYVAVSRFNSGKSTAYLLVGVWWFVLTLAFEFLFGHFVVGKPWLDILQVFDISSGDLFILALFTTLVAPWIAAKLRGLI